MRGNPGTIIQLTDGRHCIIYNAQPLLKEKRKVVLTLLDDDLAPVMGEDNKPKIILKDLDEYNDERLKFKVIGYVD